MFMDKMASSEFRRRYASLTKPVIVTVSGHPIGVWTPGSPAQQIEQFRERQAGRDDLLRKINRGR
jgi:hypothetical protein